ncbi:UDP-N-acetylglucosamine 2-epimerase [Arenibacter algicola]|uniref:UDP-N-acetylglucosamine 2-epimerase n=1 Tax=Arenibacter algicola TaxID=616991 RepID=UPI003D1568CD
MSCINWFTTYIKKSPFPEEINRTITGHTADYHFAPTPTSFDNLKKEGIRSKDILITGNTVIDTLFESVSKVEMNPFILSKDKVCPSERKYPDTFFSP